MKLLTELFLTFAKIGLFTFGGGYAMLSIIEDTCVERKQWITHDEMMNLTVIAESTPGPIAINCATYVGCKQRGLAGAIAATVGMVLPSLCVICLLSLFMDHLLEIPWVAHAFWGIKIAVGILILDVAVRTIRRSKRGALENGILITACAVMMAVNLFSLHVSSIALMLAAGAVTLTAFLVRKPKEVKRE